MPAKGEAHDPDTRLKISESLTGKKLPESHKRHISEGKIAAFIRHEEEHEYQLPKSKVCSKCGKRKNRDRFLVKKKKLKSGIIREYLAGECKKCANERSTKWREQKRKEGLLNGLERRYDRNRSEESKERHRETRRIKRHEDSQREGRASRTRRKSVVKKGAYLSGKGIEILPVGPIAKWIREKNLTAVPGVGENVLSAIRNEIGSYTEKISLDLVDRILTGMEEPWVSHELYPLDD